MAEMQTYSGGCHCGAVPYVVDLALEHATSCNCSMCSERGLLLPSRGPGQFRLQAGEGALQDYRFNTHEIGHLFFRNCGVESFARGDHPGDSAAMVAINLRCVEVEALPVRMFDGASL